METPPTDAELVYNITNKQCSESLIELSNRHSGIVCSTIAKYASHTTGTDGEDLYADKELIIFNAARSFEPGRSKFSTWLCNQTRFHCLNSITKSARRKEIAVDNESLTNLAEANSEERSGGYAEDCAEYVVNLASRMADPRLKRIIEMRYFTTDKQNYSTIAKELGMTAQGVMNLHDSFIAFARKKLESSTYLDII